MKNLRTAALAIGICAVLLSPSLAQGLSVRQEPTVQPELRRAIELIEEGDFAAAAELLEAVTSGPAVGQGPSSEAREMILAYLYYGIARLYLASEDDARRAFQDAQRLDPAYEPEASALPRRVMELWEEVRNLGALVVVTTPEGAAVYLDGEMQGYAPVDMAMLAPGEYRVTVTRDGYLDDTRVVTVVSSRAATVRVEMNPAEEAVAPGGAGQAETPPRGGGGLGTGALVGLLGGAGAAVGVGLAVAGGGGASSSGPVSPPVVSASVPSAPARPTLTPGDRQLGVSWTAPASNGAAITDYDVRYRRSGGGWTDHPVQFPDRSTTITGLENGTSYEVQVRAGNSVGKGSWSANATDTPASVPSAPARPTLTPGDRQLGASWTAPASNGAAITDYDVRYRRSGGGWTDHPVQFPDRSTTITGLENGTAYEVQVRAGNSVGKGSWSASATDTPIAAEYEITLTDVRFDRAVEHDSDYWQYWVRATAENTGSRSLDSVLFGVFVEFYDGNGNSVGDTSQGILGGSSWSPGEERTGTGFQYIPTDKRSSVAYYRLRASPIEPGTTIRCIGCDHEYSDAPRIQESRDRAVLMEFYNATDGPNWTDNTNWNTSAPLDQWYGVTADANGRVTELDLYDNELAGSIPPSLGSLTNLTVLWLAADELAGSIPSSLGSLTNLTQLGLTGLQLAGSIPSSLGSLTNLWDLDLSINQLTGSIPLSLGDLMNLTNLVLSDNQLTGSIPTALCTFEDTINPQRGNVYLPCEGVSANVTGFARLSVTDADAEENVDDTIDFTVTFDRAASTPVSVDYATADGSAQAGADYMAESGTLTFAPGERSKTVQVAMLDDTHDEGEETFTLALSNASGGVIVDGQATGRIKNHDPLPRALLARFGRTAAVHVVEQVEERLQAPREPGVEGRFAGQELRPGMERGLAMNLLRRAAGPAGATSGFGAPAGPMGPGVGGMASVGPGNGPIGGGGLLDMGGVGGLTAPGVGPMVGGGPGNGPMGGGLLEMGGGDLLNGSAFALNQETRQGGVLSFWSRGAQSSFVGRDGTLALDGDVRTTMFGADYAKGPVVVGLSLSNSRGLGNYAGVDAGRVATSVTGLYPWLGYRVTDRVTVWGVTGYGTGGMMLTPGGGPALESGLSMAMAAGGTRGELIGGGSGGFGLAFKSDALWVGTSLEGVDGPAGRLAPTEAAVTRFRTGLEGSREFVLGGRVSLRPSAEVGLRHDGGDAETGAGMDVGGGLVLADSVTGLSVDVRVRMLVAHQAEGFRERGMALSFSFDPTPSTPLGFAARVAPAWGGQATGGAEALWGRETMAGLADGGFASGGDRLDAEVGYGLPLGSRFVGTPRMGFAATEYGRDYRMGYGVTLLQRETLDFELGVDARRRESWIQGGADSGFLGRATLGW